MADAETPFPELSPEERNARAQASASRRISGFPIYELLRWSVDAVDVDGGTMEGTFGPNPDSVHVGGMISGSYVAAMLDTVVSAALSTTDPTGAPPPHVTTSLSVNYLRASPPGALTGRGRVVRRGRSVAFTAAEILDAEGTLLATATATAYFLPANS